MSYPEKYFKEVLEKEGIALTYHFGYGIYELDFADIERKIDLEIDGDQHYLDERIVESDVSRNKKMNDDGWKVIRIVWSKYQKLSHEEKVEFIKNLKETILN